MNKIVTVHPWPMHPKVAEVFAAIEGISVHEALPGGPGPVIAIKQAPDFVCDAIVVKSPDRIIDAVHIVTADNIELVSMRQTLGASDEAFQENITKVSFQ